MGTINTYTAYHATDRKNVESIMANGFTYNKYKYHWLGNGVYFFLDKRLAIKWGEDHSVQYGAINDCSIIKVLVEVDDDDLCDMRMLDTYCYVKEKFDKYMEVIASCNIKFKEVTYKKYCQRVRCAFFDWLVKELKLKCIIAYFSERKDTLPTKAENEDLFAQFRMPYMEIQVCVSDTSCISLKEVV